MVTDWHDGLPMADSPSAERRLISRTESLNGDLRACASASTAADALHMADSVLPARQPAATLGCRGASCEGPVGDGGEYACPRCLPVCRPTALLRRTTVHRFVVCLPRLPLSPPRTSPAHNRQERLYETQHGQRDGRLPIGCRRLGRFVYDYGQCCIPDWSDQGVWAWAWAWAWA